MVSCVEIDGEPTVYAPEGAQVLFRNRAGIVQTCGIRVALYDADRRSGPMIDAKDLPGYAMNVSCSTADLPPSQRLAYWTDMVCANYVQLECDAPLREVFDGSLALRSLPGLDVSVVNASAQKVSRTPRQIATASQDCFLVSIQAEGRGMVRQDGREAVLERGDFALYDSTRPYELRFDGPFEQLVLMLPGAQLRSALRNTEDLTATAVSGRRSAGHLMFTMVQTLWRDVDELEPASAAAVARGVLDILVAGLQTLPRSRVSGSSSLAAHYMASIKRLIDERLCDPALDVSAIAAHLNLSVSQVHRLFKSEEVSPAQYIWSRRFEACSRDLLDPRRAGHSISQIAFGWGFNDAAHFSRTFRQRYGMTPREWRRQH